MPPAPKQSAKTAKPAKTAAARAAAEVIPGAPGGIQKGANAVRLLAEHRRG